jgi:hypothetical protein
MADDSSTRVDSRDLGPAEYLAYSVLSVYHEEGSGELGRTAYHKLTTLADRYLRNERGIDVGLPSYWYFYGETIRESAFEEQIAFSPASNHRQGRAYYPAERIDESDFSNVDTELKREVRSAAWRVVEEHGSKGWRELEALQYREYSPNDFVASYRDLREVLNAKSKTHRQQSSLSAHGDAWRKTNVTSVLDTMVERFPAEEYELLYDEYLLWDDTFRLLVDAETPATELREFLEEMIEAVSVVYLRFQRHQHIEPRTIQMWAREAREKPAAFKSSVESKRTEAIELTESTGALEDVAESYNETILEEIEDLD